MVNNRLQTRDVTKIYNISEMASLADIFSESEKTNWLKSWIAIDITKAGLIGFVDQEVCNVKTRIFEEAQKKLQLPATSFCTSCCTANLLRCPTINVCKRKTNAACLTHDTPGKQPRQCTLKLCDVVRDEIINEHRFSHPSWKNTSAEQWARNSWQIAKCFMPPDGYIGVSSAQDTDFNGIINIMLNCKHFDLKMSFIISSQLQNTPCLLTKAREFCKAVRHTTDCKVADADLKDMFTSLISLLSDPKSLANDQYAQEAVVKLGQLEQDSLNFAEVCQLLNESLQHAAEYNKQHFSVLEEVKAYMQTHQVEFDKHVSEQKHMICATGQTYIQLIKDATSNTEQNNYDEAVQDFRRLLKTYYDKTFSHVGLSLLKPYADMPLKDIYVKHKLFKTGKQNGQTKKTDRVYSYRELIYNEDMIFRHICIQGEPGMGKSTFAAKLLQDWCKSEVISDASDNRTAIFNDIETLQEFAFVFLILLRESNDKNDILEMIATQIIAEIYSTDEQKDACKLLKRIMKREKCLLVQDGLDEWADPKGKLAMPRIVTRYQPCTTLTTTRLWRMTDERIKDSNIDSLLELEGVDDPFELAKKVLCYLDSNSRIDTFRGYVFGNKLYELIKTPMLMSFIVCCYVDEVHLTGSHCNIYGLLLDSLFKKASKEGCFFETSPAPCLEFTKYLQPNEKCLDAMSKLAFDRLFSLDKSTSLVFSEKDLLCMSKKQRAFALKSGVVTTTKSLRLNKPHTCWFIHKSIQEFLAAFFIARKLNDSKDKLSEYMTKFADALSDLNLVFTFLSGLNINAASTLSILMNEYVQKVYSSSDSSQLKLLQNIIISGFEEAKQNIKDDTDISLQLSYFDFDELRQTMKCEALKDILRTNKTTVRTLNVSYDIKMSTNELQSIMNSSANSLEEIKLFLEQDQEDLHVLGLTPAQCGPIVSKLRALNNYNEEHPILHADLEFKTLKMLKRVKLVCDCKRLDLSPCDSLDAVHLLEPVTLLPTGLRNLKKLRSVHCECYCEGLDLFSCDNLEVVILGSNVTLLRDGLPHLTKLRLLFLACLCDGLDLSSCHNLEEIELGNGVTLLPEGLRNLKKLKKIILQCNCKDLGLSTCDNLETIHIGTEVTLLPKGLQNLKKLRVLTFNREEFGTSPRDKLKVILRGSKVALQPKRLSNSKMYKKFKIVCKINEVDEYEGEEEAEESHCEGLDLSSCDNLEVVILGTEVTMLPEGLSDLKKLWVIDLECHCKGLDLSSCDNLETIKLGNKVTLLPKVLRNLNKLKILWFLCNCEGLGVCSCDNLEQIILGSKVTLLPKSLFDLKKLRIVTFECHCKGLDLSSFEHLEKIYLGTEVTLLPEGLRNLNKLKILTLKCYCEGLGLSTSDNLEEIKLGSEVTLLPEGLRNLKKLKKLTLRCKSDCLGLSTCDNLEEIFIGTEVTLLPERLSDLKKLRIVHFECRCDELDLSSCDNLETVKLGSQVTLLPNGLNGSKKLISAILYCKCDGLNLFPCNRIETVEISKTVTMSERTLEEFKKMMYTSRSQVVLSNEPLENVIVYYRSDEKWETVYVRQNDIGEDCKRTSNGKEENVALTADIVSDAAAAKDDDDDGR